MERGLVGKTTLEKKLGSYCALILNRKSDETASGTLMRYQGRTFVVTCRHILEGATAEDIGISLGQSTKFSFKMTLIFHTTLDLASIELDPVEVKYLLGEGREAYNLEQPAVDAVTLLDRSSTLPCCGVGIPCELKKVNEEQEAIFAETFFFAGQLEPSGFKPPNCILADMDGTCDEYWINMKGEDFLNEYGEDCEFDIHPSGLSGTSIWIYNPATEATDRPEALWVGVQVGALIENRYLHALNVLPIIEIINSMNRKQQ